MESFLLVCSRDVSSFCEEILHLTLKFLSYDPYVADNMEEDTDNKIYEKDEEKYDVICMSCISCVIILMCYTS